MLNGFLEILQGLGEIEPIQLDFFGAVTYQTGYGLKGHVGMDHTGTVTQQTGKVVFLPGLACLGHQTRFHSLSLPDQEMEWLKGLPGSLADGDLARSEFVSVVLPALFPAAEGTKGLEAAVERLCQEAARSVDEGKTILILSDRGVSPTHAPIPMLIAVGAVHHHLIREGARTKVGLVVESGEPREVQHFPEPWHSNRIPSAHHRFIRKPLNVDYPLAARV